jgi:ribosomal protein S18 acetylase RimI-like enzyme
VIDLLVESPTAELEIRAALDCERQFVLTLGGFALEIAGAALVTHEKLPVPRFNFVQELGVGRERQASFFEHALDHYFQRALRPTFRVPEPVAEHLDRGLRKFGFQPRTSPLVLMLSGTASPTPSDGTVTVREADHSDLDVIASFWTSEAERPEFRTALDVAWMHPNPHETLVPIVASIDENPVAAALVYRHRSAAGIYAVATRPSARGQGAASEMVRFAISDRVGGPASRYSIFADSARLVHRLETLGFEKARAFIEYELPTNAQLAFPSPGPPLQPRWRPPRGSK